MAVESPLFIFLLQGHGDFPWLGLPEGIVFRKVFFLRRENHFPFPVRLDVKPWPSKRRIVSDFGFASGLASRSNDIWRDVYVGSSKDIKFLYQLLSRLCFQIWFCHSQFSLLSVPGKLFQCDLYVSNGWAQPTPKFVCIGCCLKRLSFLKIFCTKFSLAEGSRFCMSWIPILSLS